MKDGKKTVSLRYKCGSVNRFIRKCKKLCTKSKCFDCIHNDKTPTKITINILDVSNKSSSTNYFLKKSVEQTKGVLKLILKTNRKVRRLFINIPDDNDEFDFKCPSEVIKSVYDFKTLSLVKQSDNLPFVRIRIGDISLTALLDSGASCTVLDIRDVTIYVVHRLNIMMWPTSGSIVTADSRSNLMGNLSNVGNSKCC